MPFVSAIDLGKLSDFSALAVLQQSRRLIPGQPPGGLTETHYFVGYLKRFPKRTPYVARNAGETGIVEAVKAIFWEQPELRYTMLAVDQTGVGVAVVDCFRRAQLACTLRPITITAGSAITFIPEENGWHVPKKELVSTLEVLLQNRRLTVAKGMPESDILKGELQNFQTKISKAANEQFGNWRDGEHDDLVLSLCLATWLGERSALDWDGSMGNSQQLRKGLLQADPSESEEEPSGSCRSAQVRNVFGVDERQSGGW